jgi:hypothetical protein
MCGLYKDQGMEWINVAQNRDKLRFSACTVVNNRVT